MNDQAHLASRIFAAYELARAPSMLIELETLSSITSTYMLLACATAGQLD
jgi:hypothetical protein